jgi:hypothetical protein
MNKHGRPFSATNTMTLPLFPWAFAVMAGNAVWPLEDGERGDVPGWVMITLMSAILVAGLLAIASPALADLFAQAMAKVGG